MKKSRGAASCKGHGQQGRRSDEVETSQVSGGSNDWPKEISMYVQCSKAMFLQRSEHCSAKCFWKTWCRVFFVCVFWSCWIIPGKSSCFFQIVLWDCVTEVCNRIGCCQSFPRIQENLEQIIARRLTLSLIQWEMEETYLFSFFFRSWHNFLRP